MTYEELKEVITECLQDNDKLITESERILNAYNEILEAGKTKEEEINKLKEKNDELREACGVWMNRAGIINETTKKEEPESYEEITKRLKNKMKGIK